MFRALLPFEAFQNLQNRSTSSTQIARYGDVIVGEARTSVDAESSKAREQGHYITEITPTFTVYSSCEGESHESHVCAARDLLCRPYISCSQETGGRMAAAMLCTMGMPLHSSEIPGGLPDTVHVVAQHPKNFRDPCKYL